MLRDTMWFLLGHKDVKLKPQGCSRWKKGMHTVRRKQHKTTTWCSKLPKSHATWSNHEETISIPGRGLPVTSPFGPRTPKWVNRCEPGIRCCRWCLVVGRLVIGSTMPKFTIFMNGKHQSIWVVSHWFLYQHDSHWPKLPQTVVLGCCWGLRPPACFFLGCLVVHPTYEGRLRPDEENCSHIWDAVDSAGICRHWQVAEKIKKIHIDIILEMWVESGTPRLYESQMNHRVAQPLTWGSASRPFIFCRAGWDLPVLPGVIDPLGIFLVLIILELYWLWMYRWW